MDQPAPRRAVSPWWIGPTLVALLLTSFALRTWDASQGLSSRRYFDERFTFKNVASILKQGEFRPRHAFYLSLSYLPQAAVLGASEGLYRATRYQPFSIYAETPDGYSPTAYWLARMVNVLYGVLSLWLVFLIGRRIHSPGMGLLAAAILAAFPRHVLSSTEFKPDILVILLTVLTFYWTLGAALRPGLGRFLGVGLGVGLAVSTKYTGIASAIPITAAVLVNGWRDRRQWGWLVMAGLASVVTFVALNPYLGVVFQFIPRLVNGYAAKGVQEKSDHGVVFQRQLAFLNEHHGPVIVGFVALGVVWMLWRIFRPRPEDSPAQRLGSILVLSLLLGYSVLHSLGMTLFRGQNYLPVVPFSSLAAAWAVVELWRALARRLPALASKPLAALIWIGIGAALLWQQAWIVYIRVVPTNFAIANDRVLAGLDPAGLRHVIYESGLGAFGSGGRPRRPLISRVERFSAVDPGILDRADVEIFPRSRLDGPDADFYRRRLARLPRSRSEIVESRLFRSRGEPVLVLRHPWDLEAVWTLRIRRPEGAPPFLVSRLPEAFVRPGDTVSLVAWVPREAADRKRLEVRLDPGGRLVPVSDTGRRLARYFRTSPRFHLTGQEVRVRLTSPPPDRPRGFGVEMYRWKPSSFLLPRTPGPAAPAPAPE